MVRAAFICVFHQHRFSGRKLSGTVSWEVLAWVVGLIVAAGSAVAVFLFWVWRLLTEQRTAWQAAIDATIARLATEEGRAKAAEEETRRALEAHKLYAAETFATAHELATALGEVKSAIDRLTGRLDQILTLRTPPGSEVG